MIQRRTIIGVVAIISLGVPALAPQLAGASSGETIKFTVPVSVYNQAKAAAATFGISGANGIWKFALCKSPPEPVPTVVKTSSGTIFYKVVLSASQVTASNKAIRKNCGRESIRKDYQVSLKVTAQVTATTTTTAPPESPAQYEAACTAAPAYGQLTSPNAQTGLCVTFEAQVFQYDSRTGTTEMLVDVTNDGFGLWTDAVELKLPQSVVSQNFIQNDVLRFWGTTAAADTYQTASGGSNTVPVVDVKYATLVSAAGS